MNRERTLHETIARCVSILVYYHHDAPDRDAEARMASEIRAVAGSISAMGLELTEGGSEITRPVERELLLRYGPEAAPRMARRFIDAFRADRVAVS